MRRVARVDPARAPDALAAMLSTLKPWLSRSHGPDPTITAALEALVPRGLQVEVQHYLAEPVRAYTAPSGIKDAGAGLFAKRRVRPGEILTLFPGVVHPPNALCEKYASSDARQSNPSYIMALSDGATIDGTPDLLDACTVLRRRAARSNALGHLANHPPRGRPPNILMVDMGGIVDRATASSTPTVPSGCSHGAASQESPALGTSQPGWHSLRLVALVAVDPLAAGTEALLDYGHACPGALQESWYVAVPREQTACVRALARGQVRAMYGL